ncbi:MAG: alpha-galactosidase [Planctomycetes bacterium]|nr:alpha-galactosidase [Planctomycetota bacterium]
MKNAKSWMGIVIGCGALLGATRVCGSAEGYIDISMYETGNWDFPAGRCGGHAHTGIRWTAPKAATIVVRGSTWKIRVRPGIDTSLSLWIKGRKLIDHVLVHGKSDAPYDFAQIITDQKGDPAALTNISVTAGDEIYVQIDGNDFTGLDLTIRGAENTWDLAADFSEESNPTGPWAYGEVLKDAAGTPSLNLFESRKADFDPEDFGKGQPAWCSTKLTWYWSMMKSRGTMAKQPGIRFTSDQAIYVESFLGDRWVGRFWSADGRINVSYESWAEDAFQLGINNEQLSTGWKWVSGNELDRTERGARHFIVELSNTIRPVRLKVHTVVDGTPVLERWLEITNTGDQAVGLTACSPWSGRLWPKRSGYIASPPQTYTLGYFISQRWAEEGWFEWKPLEPGTVAITCDQGRSHDDPFFIVRNEANGEYFIGHLAWTANWSMEFQRDDAGLLFRVGPASANALRVIAPGETIETPAVHLGHVSGDLDKSVQAMHDHLRRFVLPTRSPKRSYLIQYLVPADQGYYIPFDEASAMKCVEVAAAIGAELFILDAYWWDVTCDWVPSATRFPRGLKPLIDSVHQKGMLFGLYVETEGGRGNVEASRIAQEHPDWIGPSKIINLNIPEAAAYVEAEISRVIEAYDLDLYRLDYNPGFQFTETPRDGFMENNCWRYYEAFYGIYERLHKKYPELILQQASAGGGRNDLGTVSRFHEPYLTDGLSIPREFQVYSGLTLGLPPEIFVILHGADGGVGMGKPQNLDTILRLSYSLATPQIFVGTVAPSVETLSPERQKRFLHYGRIYREFIRPLFPTCKVYHHQPINSRGGVTSSGWFAMEFAAPDRMKGWATLARIGPTESDTNLFRPRGLDPGKTYRVTFDSLSTTAAIEGWRLFQAGLPIHLESVGSSELLLFEAQP